MTNNIKSKKYAHQSMVIYLLSAVFLVILLSDIFILHLVYVNYKEKLNIIYAMTAADSEGQDGLVTAAELLRGDGYEIQFITEAKQNLEYYGYSDEFQNVYKKEMYRQMFLVSIISALIYVTFVLSVFMIRQSSNRKRHKELGSIRLVIAKLRDGRYFETDSDSHMNPIVWNDNEGISLKMDLESLSSYLKLIRRQAGEEKEETKALVTDISHQLKTPVAALKTSFEVLKSPGLTRLEKEEFSNRCVNQIVRLEELISSLIHISRMENGMIQIHKKECRIFDTLVLAVNRIYPDAEEKKIYISIDAEEDMQKLLIPHDVKWLSEAIINILENAVKYSDSDSAITIRMIKMTTFLRIEIEDEGMGIPMNERNKVFKRFYRGESEGVMKTAGSGVGLYLTREIMELHGGTVTVTNSKEKKPKGNRLGSIFVLQIPYK